MAHKVASAHGTDCWQSSTIKISIPFGKFLMTVVKESFVNNEIRLNEKNLFWVEYWSNSFYQHIRNA